MDALSWPQRDLRFSRKFKAGRLHIPQLFTGLDLPNEIDQIALLCFASRRNRSTVGGGRIVLVQDLVHEITKGLKGKRVASDAVPEDKPLLRSLQFAIEHIDTIRQALTEGPS
jgi:hypothetical protein